MQSVLFDKNVWTSRGAKSWLLHNKHKPIKSAHITDKYIRFRLKDPATQIMPLRTISLAKSIKAITGFAPRKRKYGKGNTVWRTRVSPYTGVTRGGDVFSMMSNNHGLINGLVGGIHALMSLAALGGIGYAVAKKVRSN